MDLVANYLSAVVMVMVVVVVADGWPSLSYLSPFFLNADLLFRCLLCVDNCISEFRWSSRIHQVYTASSFVQ